MGTGMGRKLKIPFWHSVIIFFTWTVHVFVFQVAASVAFLFILTFPLYGGPYLMHRGEIKRMKTFCDTIEKGDQIDEVLNECDNEEFENLYKASGVCSIDGREYTLFRIKAVLWINECFLYHKNGEVTEKSYNAYPYIPL